MKKVIIYKDLGGYSLPSKLLIELGIYDDTEENYQKQLELEKDRENKQIIKWFEEQHLYNYYDYFKIVEIPDNSYYIITEYDGYETLYYSESEIKGAK